MHPSLLVLQFVLLKGRDSDRVQKRNIAMKAWIFVGLLVILARADAGARF